MIMNINRYDIILLYHLNACKRIDERKCERQFSNRPLKIIEKYKTSSQWVFSLAIAFQLRTIPGLTKHKSGFGWT